MFNDHNIFSNNIHDAANRLRQIQEANVRSGADIMLLAPVMGSRAKLQKVRDLTKENLKATQEGKPAPKTIEQIKAEAESAGTEKSLEFARRSGQRSMDVEKLHELLPHLARAGALDDLAAVSRVLRDMGMPMTVGEKQFGTPESAEGSRRQTEFNKGKTALPPASPEDLRLAVSMMRGKYQVPWQEQPNEIHPAASDLNQDGEGTTLEVKQDAAIRSSGTDPRARAIRQQRPMTSIGPSPEDLEKLRYRESHQQFKREN